MRDGWIETSLEEIAEVIMGQSPDGKTYNQSGDGLPFMQGSAEFGEHHPTPEKWCSDPKKIAEPGDLLLSVRAPVGDTNFADQRIAVGRGLSVIRANSNSVTEFIRFVIQLNVAEMIASSGTGMFASITGKNLKEFKVLLPPLPEQKRIVDLISSVDSYIEALQQQLVSIQSIRSSISESFWSLFSLRSKLSSFGETLTGSTPPTKKLQYWESHDVDFFTPSDLGTSQKLNTANRGVSNQGAAISRPLKGFSVLQVCIGATIGKVGYLNHPAVMNQQINALTNLAEHDAPILAAILSSETFQSIIKNTAGGSTLPIISKSSWGEIEIPNVPEGERINISLTVLELDSSIEQSRQLLLSAEKLRSSILHNLLSGEHQIPASYDKVIGAA
jgi:type I restriction enzyme S subunit